MSRSKIILTAIIFIIAVIFWKLTSTPDDSSSTSTSVVTHHQRGPIDDCIDTSDETFISANGNNKKTVDSPSSSPLSDADYYPNGRPDRTISIVNAAERKRLGLCNSVLITTSSASSSSNSLGITNSMELPWIVEDVIIGTFTSLEQIFQDEEFLFGYKKEGVKPSSHNDYECFLPFGHIRRILGRTRLTAILKFSESMTTQHQKSSLVKLSKLLSIYAPSWRIVSSSSQNEIIHLERRAKVFVFGITGGGMATAQRSRYAEATWGSRTPIQWFSDQWDDHFRPIYKDQHPLYVKDRFNYLTFKISRVWQIVFKYYYTISHERIDWFIRLWDDNYFYEENLYPILYRLPFNPQKDEVLAGKLGWRHLGPADAVFPFAGGGAGWYLSSAGMKKFGSTIDEMEAWIPKLRARTDIWLPHGMHDEDVFLTAWIGTFQKINCTNIPGVEHVSPGMNAKQRCMSDAALFKLRWDPNATIFFDYTGAKSRSLRIEDSWYSYTKPIIWHYMSPKRLLKLEELLYPKRAKNDGGDLPSTVAAAPATAVDQPSRKRKGCYPGVPEGGAPKRGVSLFEEPLPEKMKDEY